MKSENYCEKNEVLLKEVEKSYGEKPLSEKLWAGFINISRWLEVAVVMSSVDG